MADRSSIEWCDATWNPVTGCTPVSAGCANCYAERMESRNLPGHHQGPFSKVAFHPDRLDRPLRWRKPKRIFVCSMGDLFHEDVKEEWIDKVIGVTRLAPQHTFMLLTKRPEMMRSFFANAGASMVRANSEARRMAKPKRFICPEAPSVWPRHNLWLGVTVEGPETLWRVDALREIKASVRFISFEPMLAYPGTVDLSGISWVILGGETGPKARYMPAPIPQVLRDQCISADIPFFFKGWGTYGMKKSDPQYMKVDGREWKQFPCGYFGKCVVTK